MGSAVHHFFPERGPGERFSVYARRGDDLRELASCPSPEGIGTALFTMDADAQEIGRRLVDEGAIGVLDHETGRWLVLPWHRPEAAVRYG